MQTQESQKKVSRINLTRTLPRPNQYTLALDGEFRNHAFNEERTPLNKGKWSSVFSNSSAPIDLEIGTGAGYFFQHRALKHPERNLVGIEIKYKPLIQTIRRTLFAGAKNAAISRFHAFDLDSMFEAEEINNVFVHFPDPWVSPKKPKNRFVQLRNLEILYDLQKPGSFLEFKTDSLVYFEWALEEIKKSRYKTEFLTFDLHQSEKVSDNFITAFEKIFIKQGIKINYILLRK
jgi:tRNA (guanine-N7-)-methyltransferase